MWLRLFGLIFLLLGLALVLALLSLLLVVHLLLSSERSRGTVLLGHRLAHVGCGHVHELLSLVSEGHGLRA